jgi:hypothetical protein
MEMGGVDVLKFIIQGSQTDGNKGSPVNIKSIIALPEIPL